jgi:hypothetical protein
VVVFSPQVVQEQFLSSLPERAFAISLFGVLFAPVARVSVVFRGFILLLFPAFSGAGIS